MITKYFGYFISCAFLSSAVLGCSQPVRPITNSFLGTEKIFEKDYTIGQKKTAFVGQPLLKLKEYQVDRYKSNTMRATDDFTISGGIVTMSGSKNTDYSVAGDTIINGEYFIILKIPGSPRGYYGVLIRSDGSVYNKVINIDSPSKVIMIYSFKVSPPRVKFVSSEGKEQIKNRAGYLNYELIYSGTDGRSLLITYREYTSEDMARSAFYQNLTYQLGQDYIRFKNIVIKVHKVDNEKIIFTVEQDGLTK